MADIQISDTDTDALFESLKRVANHLKEPLRSIFIEVHVNGQAHEQARTNLCHLGMTAQDFEARYADMLRTLMAGTMEQEVSNGCNAEG